MREIRTRIASDSLRGARVSDAGTVCDVESGEIICSGKIRLTGAEENRWLGVCLMLKLRSGTAALVVEGRVLGNACKCAVPFRISTRDYKAITSKVVSAEILVYEKQPELYEHRGVRVPGYETEHNYDNVS